MTVLLIIAALVVVFTAGLFVYRNNARKIDATEKRFDAAYDAYKNPPGDK